MDEINVEIPQEKKKKIKLPHVNGAKVKKIVRRVILTLIAAAFAISFLLPTILTFANSFMSEQEISTNYGLIFNDYTNSEWGEEKTKTYRSETVNLKLTRWWERSTRLCS